MEEYKIKSASRTFLVTVSIFLLVNLLLVLLQTKAFINLSSGLSSGFYKYIFNVVFLQIFVTIIVIIPTIVTVIRNKLSISEFLRFKKFRISDLILSFLAFICFYPLAGVLNLITIKLVKVDTVSNAISGMQGYGLLSVIIVIAIMPALFEEIQYRGLYYNLIKSAGYFISGVFSALMFSLMHMNINQLAYTFILGMVFAYIIEATGSIWITIILHFILNANSVLVLFGIYNTENTSISYNVDFNTSGEWSIIMVSLFIALLIAFIGTIILRHIARRNNKLDLLNNYFRVNKWIAQKLVFNVALIVAFIICIILMIFQLFI